MNHNHYRHELVRQQAASRNVKLLYATILTVKFCVTYRKENNKYWCSITETINVNNFSLQNQLVISFRIFSISFTENFMKQIIPINDFHSKTISKWLHRMIWLQMLYFWLKARQLPVLICPSWGIIISFQRLNISHCKVLPMNTICFPLKVVNLSMAWSCIKQCKVCPVSLVQRMARLQVHKKYWPPSISWSELNANIFSYCFLLFKLIESIKLWNTAWAVEKVNQMQIWQKVLPRRWFVLMTWTKFGKNIDFKFKTIAYFCAIAHRIQCQWSSVANMRTKLSNKWQLYFKIITVIFQ